VYNGRTFMVNTARSPETREGLRESVYPGFVSEAGAKNGVRIRTYIPASVVAEAIQQK